MKLLINLENFYLSTPQIKDKFRVFIKKYLINTFKRIIIKNRKTLDKKLEQLKITSQDLIEKMDEFIIVNDYDSGIIVTFSNITRIGKSRMIGIVKCLDFGSTVTGSPFPIFTEIIKALPRNIKLVYKRFIGLI